MGEFVQFRVEGWDSFIGTVGISDGADSNTTETLSIEVDGVPLPEIPLVHGKPPFPLEINLTGKKILTFKKKNSSSEVIFCNPRLVRNQ